jgi:hypothetical protein
MPAQTQGHQLAASEDGDLAVLDVRERFDVGQTLVGAKSLSSGRWGGSKSFQHAHGDQMEH